MDDVEPVLVEWEEVDAVLEYSGVDGVVLGVTGVAGVDGGAEALATVVDGE